MKSFCSFILFLLAFTSAHGQRTMETITGLDFYGNFLTNEHEDYGRTAHLDLRLGLSCAKSFNPPFRYSHIPKRNLTDSLARVNSFFYGARISFIAKMDNWGILKARYYGVGSEAFLRYYTPINIFLETSLGVSYGLNKAWEVDELHNNLWYIPKISEILYSLSFSLGYSLQLKGGAIVEPRIYYSLLRSTVYFQKEHQTKFNSSLDFRIAISFITKRTR